MTTLIALRCPLCSTNYDIARSYLGKVRRHFFFRGSLNPVVCTVCTDGPMLELDDSRTMEGRDSHPVTKVPTPDGADPDDQGSEDTRG